MKNLSLISRLLTPRRLFTSRSKVLQTQDKTEVDATSSAARRVYAWGRANNGSLGVAKLTMPENPTRDPVKVRDYPVRVKFFDEYKIRVKEISCGMGYTVFLTKEAGERRLLGTGINSESQMGFQETEHGSGKLLDYIFSPIPVQLPLHHPSKTKIIKAICGRGHTLVLTDKEGVFALGHNAYGQCGRPIVKMEDYSGQKIAHSVQNLPDDIIDVFAGMDHSYFLTSKGELYVCGFGADFQTGLDQRENLSSPAKIGGDLQGEKVVDVQCKADTTLALTDKGEVFAWGVNEAKQLAPCGDGRMIKHPTHLAMQSYGVSKVKKAVAAGTSIFILSDEGKVYACGFGILGKGPKVEELRTPTEIPETLFGKNELHTDSKVVDIDCGLNYAAALTNHGDLYSWGKNHWGQLGLAHKNDQYFPFKVSVPARVTKMSCGYTHMMAIAKSFA